MTALQGLRVLDLTRLLPGPFCTMLLADLGADVIKIEEPGGGDPLRHLPPLQGDTGSVFLLVNRNKRSLTLDLKTSEGRDLLLRLVDTADVVVEGFRPGVMDRLGLGYTVLSARNPRLIFATLSGFGQTGPYRDRAGHDLNYLALAGALGFNADREGQPVPPGVQAADLGGGSLCAVAILAALLARQHTGRGQAVDVSLFGASVAWLPTLLATLFSTGQPPLAGEPLLSGGLAQYDVYATADGRHVSLGALEPKFWLSFLQAVDRPDLAQLAAGGKPEQERLRTELRHLFASGTLAHWVDCLKDVDTCFAPVNTLDETVRDPQVVALEMVTSVDHQRLGTLAQISPPFAFSETVASVRRAPPDLGEHTREILSQLGLSGEQLADLATRNIV